MCAIINPPLPTIGTDQRGTGESTMRDAVTSILGQANGNLDETNMADSFAIGPVEPAFSTYKPIYFATGTAGSVVAAGTYIIAPSDMFAASGSAGTARGLLMFNPARFAAGPRPVKLMLDLTVATNAVAPGVNFTLNMNALSNISGAAGVSPGLVAGGVAAAGAGVTVNAPPASSTSQSVSADFTAPGAGQYCLSVVISGTTAANSISTCVATVWMRQV